MKRMIMDTPIGKIELIEKNGFLSKVSFEGMFDDSIEEEETLFLKSCCKQIEEYFSGKRMMFDIPVLLEGTVFQKKVWESLMKIPYGQLYDYQSIAVMIGNKNASRAVGMANHSNPLPIIIPCHRVIGKDGRMVGYLGGLERKLYLISLEKRYLDIYF